MADAERERQGAWGSSVPVYLRYGEAPEGGLSRNWGRSFFEGGTSVFKGYETPDGNYVVDLEGDVGIMAAFCCMTSGPPRPVFVLDGEEAVGRGSSGEPLLRNVTRCEPVPAGASVAPAAEIPAWIAGIAWIGRLGAGIGRLGRGAR